MYKVTTDGKVLTVVSELERCVMQTNGVPIRSDDENAPGIIVKGKIYNLPGFEMATIEKMEDDRPVIGDIANSGVASIAFVKLAETGQIDDVTATEHSDLFAQWHTSVAYADNQIVRYEGVLYRCVQAHTAQEDWVPPLTPALWKAVGDPAEEWPEWSQPIGAHDAYDIGDKVSHNGKHWTSTVAANVWEPGVYGWEEATV